MPSEVNGPGNNLPFVDVPYYLIEHIRNFTWAISVYFEDSSNNTIEPYNYKLMANTVSLAARELISKLEECIGNE